jgi:threonine/homoserine/homoserine lactone efflux protein
MILGFLTGFSTALLGWQINVVAIHRGLKRGKMASFMVGIGAVAADLTQIFIALLGAASLIERLHWWASLKWLGITTIVLVALKILFHKSSAIVNESRQKLNPTKNFLIGYLVVISNPALLLLWVGVMSFMLTHAPELRFFMMRLLFTCGFFAGGALWFLILSLIILPHIINWGETALHIISKISAVLLLAAAVILALH